MDAFARRRAVDRAARWIITLGGVIIIASILAMLVFLVSETVPLWGRARIVPQEARPCDTEGATGSAPILGTNEYREILFSLSARGKVGVCDAVDGEVLFDAVLPALEGRTITVARPLDPGGLDWIAGTADGALIRIRLEDGLRQGRDGRSYSPRIVAEEPIGLGTDPVVQLGVSGADDGFAAAAWLGENRIHLVRLTERETPLGDIRTSQRSWTLPLPGQVRPTSLTLDYEGTHLFVGTGEGQVLEFEASQGTDTPLGSYQVFDRAVTVLGTLLGGHSVVVGGETGEVEVWFRARTGEEEELRLVRAHVFEPHDRPVAGMAASNRDKGFLTWDQGGEIKVRYSTSGATLVRFVVDGPTPTHVIMSPKADGILASTADGQLHDWALINPHPEVTSKTLFGKIQYEGYADAEYVWQSTGATDDTEPKLSLVPLIFGTLKGTFYALVVSVPLAILAALYTALFMKPEIRNLVKPAMELMAAMPSVVLGLLAGLWLAPRLQGAVPIGLAIPAVMVGVILLIGLGWRRLPGSFTRRIRPGVESFVMIPFLLIALALVLGLNPWAEGFFGGDFLGWLYTNFDIRYDQRNALIVGLAMGLAVIPIIFSISEDALSSVPRHLTAGSLALGATPWQTAWRVVLPAASPGIFSAVMIGFGRAVGETMIVLMATGNTPIMDWSVFNGFRTLSANIAVEIPEAPHGGSLYRVLFLAALLLFAITFVVNTMAELVRHRLRQRYSRF